MNTIKTDDAREANLFLYASQETASYPFDWQCDFCLLQLIELIFLSVVDLALQIVLSNQWPIRSSAQFSHILNMYASRRNDTIMKANNAAFMAVPAKRQLSD